MILGTNTKSDISKLLYVISRAVRRVKFETILKHYERSVAKCRGSWVVGRGRGSWVWVVSVGVGKCRG